MSLIGNELNLAVERPGGHVGDPIAPPSTRSRAALAIRRCAVLLVAHRAPLKKKGPGHAPVVGPAGPVQSADIEVPPGEFESPSQP